MPQRFNSYSHASSQLQHRPSSGDDFLPTSVFESSGPVNTNNLQVCKDDDDEDIQKANDASGCTTNGIGNILEDSADDIDDDEVDEDEDDGYSKIKSLIERKQRKQQEQLDSQNFKSLSKSDEEENQHRI
jgi:hypothetical protein